MARAVGASSPMACKTCDGAEAPEAQAEPVEAAMPSRSRRTTSDSASMPGKATLVVPGARAPGRPLTMAPAPSRKAVFEARAQRRSRSASVSSSPAAASAAAPKAASRAAGSLPERRPRSWPPPCRMGSSGPPRRTIKAPAPASAPSLCADSARKSAPSAARSTATRPAP